MGDVKIDDLPQFVRFKDYVKVIEILKNKPVELSEKQKDMIENQEEILRIILRNDIRFLLCNKKPIDMPKIELSDLLGEDFCEEIGDIVRQSLVDRFINNFKSEVHSQHVIGIFFKDIPSVITHFEDVFERICFVITKFPEKWNIKGEFVFRIATYLKEIVNREIFDEKYKREDFINALEAIIYFETVYTQKFFINNCCESRNIPKPKTILFENAEVHFSDEKKKINENIVLYHPNKNINVFCRHKKMISKLFYKNLSIYIKNLFSQTFNVNQENVELKVIKGFIDFFQNLGSILKKIKYFDQPQIFNAFVSICNQQLTQMIKSIKDKKALNETLIILNTLSFIESTFKDLLMRIFEIYNYSYENLECFQIKRKYEKNQTKRLEILIKKQIFNEKITRNFSEQIINSLNEKIFSLNIDELSDDIQFLMFEIIFSILFSFITDFKLDCSIATEFLIEISEIKKFLRNKYDPPMIILIENYLKIFLCDPNDTESFVTNFFLHSNNIFSFNQVIMMLKDQKFKRQLFVEYKKRVGNITMIL